MKFNQIAFLLLFGSLLGSVSHGAAQPSLSPLAASNAASYLMTQGALCGGAASLCFWGIPVAGLAGAYLLYKYKNQSKEWQKYTGIALLGTAAACLYGCVKYANLSTLYWNAYSERMNWVRAQTSIA